MPLCFLFFLLLFSSPSTAALLAHEESDSDPSAIVEGCINVITGAYLDMEIGITVPAPEPVSFQHFHNSAYWGIGQLCSSFLFNHAYYAQLHSNGEFYTICATEATGGCLTYNSSEKVKKKKYGKRKYYFNPQSSLEARVPTEVKGLSNTSSGEMSGNTNVKNQFTHYCHDSKRLHIKLCSGCDRKYRLFASPDPYELLPLKFALDTETKESGNLLKYEYYGSSHLPELAKIYTTDREGKTRFASLEFEYTKKDKKKSTSQVIVRSEHCGEARYTLQHTRYEDSTRIYPRSYVIDVQRSCAPSLKYDYISHVGWLAAFICRKEIEDRYQMIEYYHAGRNQVGGESIKISLGDWRERKVSQLKAPVGPDDRPVVVGAFKYYKNLTEVFNAYHTKTCYHYTDSADLHRVERFTRDNHLYFTASFYWDRGDLKTHTRADSRGIVHFCRTFDYDEGHNVLTERVWGNLTGLSDAIPEVNPSGQPIDNGCESFAIHRTYSQDDYHHLLTETKPNGSCTVFTYLPGTQLVTSKRLISEGSSLSREFFDYDTHGLLIKKVIDNGCNADCEDLTGVTCRKITRIIPNSLGLPEVIEEFFFDLDSRSELFLGKSVNFYTPQGWLREQQQFDQEGNLRFTLEKHYDAKGNVVLEKNAIGELIYRDYDRVGNKTKEHNTSQNFATLYRYDLSNRLIEEITSADSGERYHQYYSYDYLGNRTSHTQITGQKTLYEYDEFSRLIRTTLPNGSSTSQGYDEMGHITWQRDALGNTTHTAYNCLGKPTHVTHPDGSVERFVYNFDNTLRWQIARNGSKIEYSYDPLGNITRKEIFSPSGKLLSSSSAIFQGALPLLEIDPNGNSKRYSYDGAGRLISVITEQTSSYLEYDELGRNHRTIEWIDPLNSRVTVQIFDLLGRVVEKRVEDREGKIYSRLCSEYDSSGNVTKSISFVEGSSAITETSYNALHLPCSTVDPLGNQTLTLYCFDTTLTTTKIDPMGLKTITEHDTVGNRTCVTCRDLYGEVVAKSVYLYDAAGNLLRQVDEAICQGNTLREYVVERHYDTLGRLVTLKEGVNSPDCRSTFYQYDECGQKVADLFADRQALYYSYDALGRLCSYRSEDGTLCYLYSYDQNSNIESIVEQVSNTSTERRYDREDRLLWERLASGLELSYSYDGLGRLTQTTLPDRSLVRYRYDSAYLREVTRINPWGEDLYSHYYQEYDLSGLCKSQKMIYQTGELELGYDAAKRLHAVNTPFFSEICSFDAVGNITSTLCKDPLEEIHATYRYNSLYQLIEEEGAFSHTYQYDSLHNRLQKDGGEYQIDLLNRLTATPNASYQYDARGNRTEENGKRYRYDTLNRLLSVEEKESRIEYFYDGFNRCTSRLHYQSGQLLSKEDFLYQNQLEIGLYREGELAQFRMLGRGLGADVGATVAIEMEGEVYAPIHNHRGDIVALIDTYSSRLAEFYRYNAYGEMTLYQNSWLWGIHEVERATTPWQFSSKRYDPDTKLTHFGRRQYDASVGRWLNTDPRGYEEGPNLYAYVHSNPLSHIDLFGLAAERCRYCGRPIYRGRESDNRSYRPSTFNCLRSALLSNIGWAGHHLIPLRPLQRAWMHACSAIGNFTVPKDYLAPSQVFHLPATSSSPHVASYINGINTSLSSALETARNIQKGLNGCAMNLTYTADRGMFRNIIGCVANKFGFKTRSQAVCELGLNLSVDMARKQNGCVVSYAFSRGGLTFDGSYRHLDNHTLSMMYPITCGTSRMVTDRRFGGSSNIIHRLDAVPLIADTRNYIKAKMGKMDNVRFIGTYRDAFPGTAHTFDTYYYKAAVDEGGKMIEKYIEGGSNW